MDALRRGPILVIDDDLIVRLMICRVLEDDGLVVIGAASAQQAFEQAKLHRPALVVLDASLPTIDGRALADTMRVILGQTLPIILITAANNAAELARAVGAFDFLRKPFDVDELTSTVRRAQAST